jgi:hypothetical protein
VKLKFEIEGTGVEFSRNSITGRSTLTTDTETKTLQSPFNPFTHFSWRLRRRWPFFIKGHEVSIELQRPLLFAGFRPQTYRVLVDGKVIQERDGF